jgi:hypothetical protein
MAFSQVKPRLLRVHEPSEKFKKKYDVFLDIQDIESILKDPALDLSKGEIHIRLFNPQGQKIAKLGVIKRGRIKWLHKRLVKRMLCINMEPPHAEELLKEVGKKRKVTCYQLLLTSIQKDSDYLKVLKAYPLTFFPHVDLYGVLIYPLYVAPGSDFGEKVTLKVVNEGMIAAENFFVELVLSTDKEVPLKPGISSNRFQEDMLLKNGRVKVDLLLPGESITLQFKSPLTVPDNTPPGKYNLGAVIDPENYIKELHETNNRLSRFLFVTNDPSKALSQVNKNPVDITTHKLRKKE